MIEVDLLVWNLWHGLNPYTPPIAMRPVEKPWELLHRIAGQEKFLQSHFLETSPAEQGTPLIYAACLQELNPIHLRLERLARITQSSGFATTGNSGPRVGPLAVPLLLREGLGTLVRGPLSSARLYQRELSGAALEWEGPWHLPLHLQLGERRVSQKVKIKSGRRRFTLCNLHLHNGPRGTEAQARRLQEVKRLLRFLSRELSQNRPTILCGDFNCDPEDAELRPLQEAGFEYISQDLRPTWHPRLNPSALLSSQLAKKIEDAEWDRDSHLFDQVWIRGPWQIQSLRRVADEPYSSPKFLGIGAPQQFLSDHFAIRTRLKLL